MNAVNQDQAGHRNQHVKFDEGTKICPSVGRDLAGIVLLTLLYIMQGIPLGLVFAVPFILQSDRNTANYQAQATFSLALWPFSLKLLWAPIVDSIYSSRFGRRKSWLIPVQYAIGADLLFMASHVDSWLGREPGNPWGALGVSNPVKMYRLTAAFFGLTFLAATQDIVVDGWALTMLSKRNVGWASTCNAVGQVLGEMVSFVLFLCLESPTLSNTYLRRTPIEGTGLVSFSGFLYFWGIAFLLMTTFILVFKREGRSVSDSPIPSSVQEIPEYTMYWCPGMMKSLYRRTQSGYLPISPIGSIPKDDSDPTVINILRGEKPSLREESRHKLSVIHTYHVMLAILKLRPVLLYIGILFLVQGCLAAVDGAYRLKLIERGVSKERLALLNVILMPMQACLPLLVTPWSNGPSPLSVFGTVAIFRLFLAISVIPLVHYTPYFAIHTLGSGSFERTSPATFSWHFYGLILTQMAMYKILTTTMSACQMAFHARISDPEVGGTYMTLLNTASNLAGTLPLTLMLYLLEPLSIRRCTNASFPQPGPLNMFNASSDLKQHWLESGATCQKPVEIQMCELTGGYCSTFVDGFYVQVILSVMLGIIAFPRVVIPVTRRLDFLSKSINTFRITNSGHRTTHVL